MTNTTEEFIEIEDVGPIERLRIPVPPDGGLVVLRSSNGKGKTTALEAVQTALSGKGKLQKRDGTLKGRVEGLGMTISVGQSTRPRGELEVYSLEGRFSVDGIVDPGIKAPEAADQHRIKALVGLSGAEADPALFYPLVNGRENFEKLCSTEPADDLPTLAGRIKRNLEQHALQTEEQAATAENRARAKREAIAGVDLEAEADERELAHELETAVANKSKIEADAENAKDRLVRAQKAAAALEDAKANYQGPTVEQAKADLMADKKASEAKAAEIADLTIKLTQARSDLSKCVAAQDRSSALVKTAESHLSTIAIWQQQVYDAKDVQEISPEEIEAAADAVTKARERDRLGHQARDARQKKAEAEKADSEAKQHRTFAEQLRAAAKGTNDVLSEAVAQLGTPLKVIDGRLAIKTGRGDTYFGELSTGERWKLALDIAINAVGIGGCLAISQEAWEGLDATNRGLIAEHVKGKQVLLITAEATDGELRAETYQTNGD